jgi:hypothetical protein
VPLDKDGAQDLALAVSGNDIVVAWASFTAGVHVGRFDSDLVLVEGLTVAGRRATRVALARAPSGYILVFSCEDGVHVQTLDRSAHPRGAARTIADAELPNLVPAFDATGAARRPLLTWLRRVGDVYALEATVLPEDSSEPAPRLPALATSSHFNAVHGAFTGSGFLLAVDAEDPQQRILMIPIGPQGGYGAKRPLVLENRSLAGIIWSHGEGRLVTTNGYETWLESVSAAGSVRGTPELLTRRGSGVSDRFLRFWTARFVGQAAVAGDAVSFLMSAVDGERYEDPQDCFPPRPSPSSITALPFVFPARRAPLECAIRHRAPTLAVLHGIPPNGLVPYYAGWWPVTPEATESRIASYGSDVVAAWLAQRYSPRLVLARMTSM